MLAALLLIPAEVPATPLISKAEYCESSADNFAPCIDSGCCKNEVTAHHRADVLMWPHRADLALVVKPKR